MDHETKHLLDSGSRQQYRLSGESEQRRLEELSDRDAESVSDVSGEIGLRAVSCRAMCPDKPWFVRSTFERHCKIVGRGRTPR